MRFRIPTSCGRNCGDIVAEDPGLSELGKQAGTNSSGVTDMNLPSRAQPLTNEPADLLSGW